MRFDYCSKNECTVLYNRQHYNIQGDSINMSSINNNNIKLKIYNIPICYIF